MKNWTIILFIFFIISSHSYASVTSEKAIELRIDGEVMHFDTEPILINNQIMVPMRPFFESLGTQVTWIENTRTVTAYKSNMFIKLKIDSKTAYKNGNRFTLKASPVIRNSRTLVPAQFISETFGLKTVWISDRIVDLVSSAAIPEYYRFGDYFYKKQILSQYGVTFSIPNYWDVLDSKNYIYGVKSSTSPYTIQFSRISSSAIDSLDGFLENQKQLIKTQYPDAVFAKSVPINYNNLNGYRLKATHMENGKKKHLIYNFFYSQNYGYTFKGIHFDEASNKEMDDVFANIVSTFQLSKVSVDAKNEHYVEYPNYYDMQINMDQNIHSNMEVKNSFKFSGTLNDEALQFIYARVAKGNESTNFKLPIDEKRHFEGNIYTPFGLGKHDVYITTKKSTSINNSIGIMQFSVINLSSDKIRYLIPSERINSDNEYIASQANLITYQTSSEYEKARNIYDWIIKEIELQDVSSLANERTSEKVYLDKVGTDLEIAHLYAAFLRSIEIPTKIVTGTFTEVNSKHTWTEIYINGKWMISDPVYEMRYGNVDIANSQLYTNYFRMNFDHYNTLFERIVTASY